jgi:hypothetical protein
LQQSSGGIYPDAKVPVLSRNWSSATTTKALAVKNLELLAAVAEIEDLNELRTYHSAEAYRLQ